MSTPAPHSASASAVGEVAQRRDRMQATIDELQRVVRLAESGDGRWREAVTAAVEGAAATWERHVSATEAPQGILADVLQQEPRLGHLVATLRGEHSEIRALLDQARGGLTTGDPTRARQDVEAVAERLARHHRLGAELIYSAYDVDLGGSD